MSEASAEQKIKKNKELLNHLENEIHECRQVLRGEKIE